MIGSKSWVVIAAIAALACASCERAEMKPGRLADGDYTPAAVAVNKPSVVSVDARTSALRRARVWEPPSTPIERADFSTNPPDPATPLPSDTVPCKFHNQEIGGLTPKFFCTLKGGE